jgi:hypothetical protein
MVAESISQMISEAWFWLAIVAGLLVVLHFARKKHLQPLPISHESLDKHRKVVPKVIVTATDALLIGAGLFGCMIFFSALREDFRVLHDPLYPQAIRPMHLSLLFVDVVVWSGILSTLIGPLSFFQSNLTKFKRIILLIVCLLPALFTVPALLTSPAENRGVVLLLGVVFSAPSWIENGPSMVTGQPLFDIVWGIMRKLHLVSGDAPD